MNLIFWQNIVSPHQSDFLKELSTDNNVTLVVQERKDSYRNSQHWDDSVSSDINLIINPSLFDVISLIRNNGQAAHFFSGFFAYKKVSLWLLITIAMHANSIYIISEAVESESLFGYLKLTCRRLFAKLTGRFICGVLSTGQRSKDYFARLGFDRREIYEFGYFVNVEVSNLKQNKSDDINVIFAGRLVECKGVENVISSISELVLKGYNITLTIVGSGPLESSLKLQAQQLGILDKNVQFISDIPRKNVLKKIESSDILVLPNVAEEGWGVVVNEALLLGTPVICTQYTGSNVIVEQGYQGKIVRAGCSFEISEAILECKEMDREYIYNKSRSRLAPVEVAKYLIDIINGKTTSFSPWAKL